MLRNIKIGQRLLLGFGLLVAISVLVGASAYYRLTEIKANLHNLAERRLPAALLAGEMNREFLLIRLNTINLLVQQDSSSRSALIQALTDAKTAYLAAETAAEIYHKSAAGRATFDKVLAASDDYNNLHQQLMTLLEAGQFEEALKFRDARFANASKQMTDALTGLADYQRNTGKKQAVEADASIQAAELTILFALIVALVAGIGLAIIFSRSLTGPMAAAVAASETIAQGDLSQPLSDQAADEAGALIRAMAKMQQQLRNTIDDISKSASQLTVTAEELHTVTDNSAATMSQQSSEVDMAATAVTELTTAIEEVARNAAATSNNSAKADDTAKTGQQQVEKTIGAIQQLELELQQAQGGVQQLSERVNQIGSVLDVIRAIAEQTNLLALNAAIEAARAGESGRGFAVVADEVRALAHRTQESTKQIEVTIHTVQQETAQTVVAMGHSSQRATDTLQLARQAGDALQQITAAIGQISDQNMTIASAAEEQATVAREVDRNLLNIRDLSAQTAAGADETRASSESLAQLAEHLDTLVREFKV